MANLLLSVIGAFAEFERALTRERRRVARTLIRPPIGDSVKRQAMGTPEQVGGASLPRHAPIKEGEHMRA